MRPPNALPFAVLLFWAGQAVAQNLGGRDRFSDPSMIEEIENAKESNLDNALETSRPQARKSSDFLLALMSAARAHVDRILGNIAAVSKNDTRVAEAAGEDDLLALQNLSQSLGERTAAYRDRIAAARIAVPKLKRDELLSLRRGYTAPDRASDLRQAEKFLRRSSKRFKKRRKIELEKPQAELLSAAADFKSELTVGHKTCSTLFKRLRRTGKKTRLVRELQLPLSDLKTDLADFGVEMRRLEVSMLLMRHEDEAFDMITD